MNITTSQLENVIEVETITAVSTFGTGFLTAVVTYFIELFGIENNMLIKKIEKARNSAMHKLMEQAKAISSVDGIMNLNYQLSGKTVLVSGTAYKFSDSFKTDTTSSLDDVPEI